MKITIASVCLLVLVAGCARSIPPPTESAIVMPELLLSSAVAVAAQDPGAALDLLEQSFAAGLARPSTALWNPELEPIRGAPESRARLRELLGEHARESVVRMTSDREPGEPLTLRVTLRDEYTGATLPGAILYVAHTNIDGLYATDTDAWNPRLFGFARADRAGRVEFRTIRPGYYPPEVGIEPAHVHFHAELAGYRPFDSEIWFEDDPRATPEAIAATGRYGAQLAPTRRTSAGWTAEVTIALQPF